MPDCSAKWFWPSIFAQCTVPERGKKVYCAPALNERMPFTGGLPIHKVTDFFNFVGRWV